MFNIYQKMAKKIIKNQSCKIPITFIISNINNKANNIELI